MQKVSFEGKAGAIDCVIEWPDQPVRGWALVLHPHPLHGGARDNKIVTTIARVCQQHGLVAVRPNFRGVGGSAGAFDHGIGETADMHALVDQFAAQNPDVAKGKWVLAGFSFGTSVAAQLYSQLSQDAGKVPDELILVGSAVNRFKFRDINVPVNTLLIHGEDDEVVPLSEAMDFARTHKLPMVVMPEATHFFHGKLVPLKQVLSQRLPPRS